MAPELKKKEKEEEKEAVKQEREASPLSQQRGREEDEKRGGRIIYDWMHAPRKKATHAQYKKGGSGGNYTATSFICLSLSRLIRETRACQKMRGQKGFDNGVSGYV